jgi:predicted dehydrogenase
VNAGNGSGPGEREDRALRFGFVGAGEVAVASAEAVMEAPTARLVAVFDIRTDLAEDLAARFGGRTVPSLGDLLAAPDVDAVYVCLPHFLHRETAVRAAEAGRHVLVEKPMGLRAVDAEAIVAACREHRVACGVAFVVREAPAYRQARSIVGSGEIGEVTGFGITYRGDKPASYWTGGWSGRAIDDWRMTAAKAGGGVLLMNAIHDLDAILWITGLEVEQVQGAISRAGPAEVEDTALAVLSCVGGALGTIEALASVPGAEGPSLRWVNRIYGTQGQILLPTPWGEEGLALFTRRSGKWTEMVPERRGDARALAFEGFAQAVLGGIDPPVPGTDGVRASRLVHAVYEAARSRAVIEVGRIKRQSPSDVG